MNNRVKKKRQKQKKGKEDYTYFPLEIVRQRFWGVSATGNERQFGNNAIQLFMNEQMRLLANDFVQEGP